jgi:hypothetical protein
VYLQSFVHYRLCRSQRTRSLPIAKSTFISICYQYVRLHPRRFRHRISSFDRCSADHVSQPTRACPPFVVRSGDLLRRQRSGWYLFVQHVQAASWSAGYSVIRFELEQCAELWRLCEGQPWRQECHRDGKSLPKRRSLYSTDVDHRSSINAQVAAKTTSIFSPMPSKTSTIRPKGSLTLPGTTFPALSPARYRST